MFSQKTLFHKALSYRQVCLDDFRSSLWDPCELRLPSWDCSADRSLSDEKHGASDDSSHRWHQLQILLMTKDRTPVTDNAVVQLIIMAKPNPLCPPMSSCAASRGYPHDVIPQ